MERGTTSLELTEREIEILERLASGLSDQQIADELYLSLHTVKWYNKRVYSKLGASNRTQAVLLAQDLGLLSDKDATETASPVAALPRNNLPAQVTSFVGRRHEIADVKRLADQSRLLTLTGPPGSGKTRLALRLATELLPHFKDGVYLIPLAPIQDTDNILWTLAEHIHFPFHSQDNPLEQLLHYFREKSMLLVMDNFEHVLDAAGTLMEILQAAPHVRMLVTSRERLNLYGEVNYVIDGLTLPDDGIEQDPLQAESVELFLQRAGSVSPTLDLTEDALHHVAHICRLVDGMPLGIELAATWIDVLSPGEIVSELQHSLDILAAELRGVPHSQNSMRAAFARSWNLLNDVQKAAFRRLSVFRGGFTRVAAEAVTGVELRTLQALVNKSLLRHAPETGRYEIHELLRQYAHEQLDRSGEAAALYEAYANHFADFMAERWPQLKDHRQKIALQELGADIENARAAWHYWINAGNVPQLRKFLHSFWALYDIRGWYPAGIDLFEQGAQVMRAASTAEAGACLGWLLAAQGLYSVPVRDYDDKLADGFAQPLWAAHGLYAISEAGPQHGFTLAQSGMQILKRLGKHDDMMTLPLISLFITASQLVEGEAVALQAAQDCLDIATELDDRWAIAKAKQFLAVRVIEDGEYEKAERLAHEALAAFEASGDNWSSSVVCIEVLGLLTITLRQFEAAREWIQKGLKAAEEIDFKYSMQTAYWQLGFVAVLEEKYPEAGKYWRKALGVSAHMLGGRGFIGLGAAAGARSGGRKLIQD